MKKCRLFVTLLSLITAQSLYPLTIVNGFTEEEGVDLSISIHFESNPYDKRLLKGSPNHILSKLTKQIVVKPGAQETLKFDHCPQWIKVFPLSKAYGYVSYQKIDISGPDLPYSLKESDLPNSLQKINKPETVLMVGGQSFNPAQQMLFSENKYLTYKFLDMDKEYADQIRKAAQEQVTETVVGSDDILIPSQVGIRSLVAEYLIDTVDPSSIASILEGELKKAQEKERKNREERI